VLEFLLFLLTAWAATAAGRTVLQLLKLPDTATRLERNLFGYALGLGLLAYAMLALGLLGGLYPAAGWGLLLLLAVLGAGQHRAMVLEMQVTVRAGIHLTRWGWGLAVCFALLASVALIGVWTPPTLNLEWDALSYHLADPKIYLQAHRIYSLPWESHSNFAFTAEMWYLFSFLLRGTESGVVLAKLFHFSCGVSTCLAVYAFGVRLSTPRVGQVAALLFASTPLALWEAGIAYADLAPTFLATATLLAAGTGIVRREERWLQTGAVLMGLTLSTKATSLSTLLLLALGLLLWRLRFTREAPVKAISSVALWCGLALIVGSPWFIKSIITTGNPIYPFYYHLLGGNYWNAELAKQYSAAQANFGVGTSPDDSHSAAQAVLLPWNLTMYPVPGHLPPSGIALPGKPPPASLQPFTDIQTVLSALSPVLLAALFFPVFRRGPAAPIGLKALSIFATLSVLVWFATMQYARYLLPLLPVLCLLAAWVVVQAVAVRSFAGMALAALGVCSLGWTGYIGVSLLTVEIPVAFGLQSRTAYLRQNETTYPAMNYINTQLPKSSKIVFYGNPMGFYCDRSYFWGDAQHSTLIPYTQFKSADDLRANLQKMGVTNILLNRRYFSISPESSGYLHWVYELTDGSGPPVFESHGLAVYALPSEKK